MNARLRTVLIARTLRRRGLRIYVLAVGAFLTALIGVTRLYLGVHYPTDVLAGWTVGLLWAVICGLVASRFGKPRIDGDGAIDPAS